MSITLRNLEGVKSVNVSLSTDLFYRLMEDILSGKLKHGQKLTEQPICDEYRVSRTPVREALLQLEMLGLVEMAPNRGARVCGLTERDVADIYTLRKIYEVQAVRWAIERITKEEMEDLEETFEFMEFYTQRRDEEKMNNINLNFHQIIYAAAHNRMLRQMLSSYQMYVKHNRKKATHVEQYLGDVLEEHRAIYKAFLDKNPDEGARAMEHHMEMSMERNLGGKK